MSRSLGGSVTTRGATDHFLIGQHQSCLDSGGKLPVLKTVLQYLKYLQTVPGNSNKPVKYLICCPLITNLKVAGCGGAQGCGSGGYECVVSALTKLWKKSGISTISDHGISVKVFKHYFEWKAILKHRKKSSSVDLSKRESFQVQLDQLCDIAAHDAIEIIKSDRLRSEAARKADIDFYLDQKGPRIGYMARLDEAHKNTVERKKKRDEDEMKRKLKNEGSNNNGSKHDTDDENTENIADEDEEYVAPCTRTKKPDVIPLLVPRNIVKTLALNSKRFKISDAATSSNLALVINESNGNLDDFVLSTSTVRREGIAAVKKNAQDVMIKFKENLTSKDLTLHFDGKSVKEFTGGKHLEQERIAVIVSSPSLETPQVLGVPAAQSSKGTDQMEVVTKLIEDWEVTDHIMALGFDTTASNTGVHAGAVTLVEQHLGRAVMWAACQRHVHELHIKHAAEYVFGPSTGPSDKMFKKFRENWGDIKDKIEYKAISGFEWNKFKKSVLEKEAKASLVFCRKSLANDTFPREDYKELVQLTAVWLGGVSEVPGFRFQWPGAFHSARFMAKSLYILKMDMLSSQLDFVSQEEKENIRQLARFVGIFFSSWFLKCAVVPIAPYQSLLSFSQMISFSKFDLGLAFTVLESMNRHTWYLTEQWVVVCLADDSCPARERKAVAKALNNTPRPDHFEPGKPDLPADFWPENGKTPSLATFVGPKSWLLPHLLGLDVGDMEWLQLAVQQWPLISGYRKFSELVSKMSVVNDPAERGVKLVQDFITTSQSEDIRQWRMLSAGDQRKLYPKNMTKQDMKEMKASFK